MEESTNKNTDNGFKIIFTLYFKKTSSECVIKTKIILNPLSVFRFVDFFTLFFHVLSDLRNKPFLHTHTHTHTHTLIHIYIYIYIYIYLPTAQLGQDMTQGQFLSGV